MQKGKVKEKYPYMCNGVGVRNEWVADRFRGMSPCFSDIVFADNFSTFKAAWKACDTPSWMLWYVSMVYNDKAFSIIERCVFWEKYQLAPHLPTTLPLDHGLSHSQREALCGRIRWMFGAAGPSKPARGRRSF
jgi:hypothetical protein